MFGELLLSPPPRPPELSHMSAKRPCLRVLAIFLCCAHSSDSCSRAMPQLWPTFDYTTNRYPRFDHGNRASQVIMRLYTHAPLNIVMPNRYWVIAPWRQCSTFSETTPSTTSPKPGRSVGDHSADRPASSTSQRKKSRNPATSAALAELPASQWRTSVEHLEHVLARSRSSGCWRIVDSLDHEPDCDALRETVARLRPRLQVLDPLRPAAPSTRTARARARARRRGASTP
jgi:hypothetical protein